MENKVYTADDMRKVAYKLNGDVCVTNRGELSAMLSQAADALEELDELKNNHLKKVEAALRRANLIGMDCDREIARLKAQLADAMERDEKRFIIRSNDDGSVWVSPHRWLKGHCAKATVFSSAFYAKKAVEFEKKSKSGREQLPQVYEIMEDGRLRIVSEEECAK